jgi:hypothetical protein
MKVLLFLIAMGSVMCLPAQETADTAKVKLWTVYPGYVITRSGDTIHGFIKLNNLVDNQRKALFYQNKNDEKYTEKYKPKEIKAYRVGPRFYESFKFWPQGEDRGYHFFLKVIAGPISLYKWYYEPQSRSEERVKIDEDNIANSKIDLSFSEDELESETIAIKLNGEPTKMDNLKFITNFKKHMSRYVDDYPELSKKIAQKQEGYGYTDLEKIIREYNTWYLKHH